MLTCTAIPNSDWPSLAPFLHRHNRRPDGRVHCLHTEQGETEGSHAQELREAFSGVRAFTFVDAHLDEIPRDGTVVAYCT